jgi:hypothetical protein
MRGKWSLFVGAAILVVGLLLKVGAPAESILAGVVLAALVTWKGVGRLGLAFRRASK